MLTTRLICALVLLTTLLASCKAADRIPRNLYPTHYDVEIRADFYPPLTPDQFFFDGWVTIHLRCDMPTDLIYVHTKILTVNSNSVDVRDSANAAINVISSSDDRPNEFLIFQLARQLVVGETITIFMNFTGPIRRDYAGFYYSQYNEGGVTKYMLGTQFQASDARKAFPNLDEPLFKSTFTVKLWRKEPMIALSNTPEDNDVDGGNGWRITTFEETNVVMSSYLVAFAIANFTWLESETDSNFGGETPLREYTRNELIQTGQVDYAHGLTAPMLEFLEIHYNHAYLPVKLDHIALPDFAYGAMENWGLITYRESRLVMDPLYSGEYDRERIAIVIAHETVHMWLGDVVTCEWWSDIWTQESNAQFYQHRAVGYTEPTWDMHSIFVVRVLITAFNADDSGNLNPLYYDGDRPTSSAIIYDKGASVIRMVEQQFLGYESFHRAMVNYIDDNQYSIVTHEDLLGAWDRQATIDGLNLPVNVTVAALTWVRQSGYPVIKLSVRADGTTVDVTQRLFLELPDMPLDEYYPSPYGYTWYVPVTYTTSNGVENVNLVWLHRNNRTISLPASVGSTGWILGNYQSFGFYRVNYDDNTWTNLANQLNNDHFVFNLSNRAMLIHDSNTFGRSGDLRHVLALQTTEYLTAENQWAPWFAADQTLAYVSRMLSKTAAFAKYKEYLTIQVDPVYRNLTWNDQAGDPLQTIHMRSLAIDVACKHEHIDCLTNAWNSFSAWRNAPTNLTIIRPDIRRAVICAAISRSLTDSWDFVFSQYQLPWHGPDALDRPRLRDALTCSTDRSVLNNYFTLAATQDARINSADYTSIMTGVAGTLTGNDVAWGYLSNNWNSMQSNRLNVLETVAQRFSTEADLFELQQFMTRYPAQSEDEQRRYDQILRVVNANIRWQAKNYAEVSAWLDTVVPTSAQSILSIKVPTSQLLPHQLQPETAVKKPLRYKL